jgi:DnaJ family protein C protein 28
MNPAEQERREQREQLRRAASKLEQRRIPLPERDAADQPRDEGEWRDLVERRIQAAMTAGTFDNLPGKGKPLHLDRNPYLDPSLELAYGLLKNNGYAPEWISRDQEIRSELEAARARLRAAWAQRRAQTADQAAWQAAVARFEEALTQLNRKIDDFNLVVPILSCQRARLRLTDELRRLNPESPQRDQAE